MSERGPQRKKVLGELIPRYPLYLFARNYDKLVDPKRYHEYLIDRGRSRGASVLSEMMQDQLPQRETKDRPTRILDIGAGTGIVSSAFSKKGWEVTAMDLSRDMLSYLKEQYPSESVFPVQADMNEPFPFSDNSFDGIISVGANRYIKSSSHFFQEVYRVLQPDGVLVLPLSFADSMRWKVFSGFSTPTHPRALRKLAKATGFSQIKLEPLGNNNQCLIARK